MNYDIPREISGDAYADLLDDFTKAKGAAATAAARRRDASIRVYRSKSTADGRAVEKAARELEDATAAAEALERELRDCLREHGGAMCERVEERAAAVRSEIADGAAALQVLCDRLGELAGAYKCATLGEAHLSGWKARSVTLNIEGRQRNVHVAAVLDAITTLVAS